MLAGIKIVTFPTDRYQPLFGDENFQIVWGGHGYAVKRKKDGHIMTAVVHTVALAERDLRSLYPKPIGRS